MMKYTHFIIALSIFGSIAAQASDRQPPGHGESQRLQCYFEQKSENGQKKDKEKSTCYVRAEMREEHDGNRDNGGVGILHDDRDEARIAIQCSNGFTLYDRDADARDTHRDVSILAREFDKMAILDVQDSHGSTRNATLRTQSNSLGTLNYMGYCRFSEEH